MSSEKKNSASRKYGSPSKIQGRLNFSSSTKISRDLFEAVRGGNLTKIEELLEHRFADVNAINPWFDGFKSSSIEYSPDYPVGEITLLMYAAKLGDLGVVRLLIENKANLDIQNEDGETALMIALKEGCVDIVKLLIEKKAALNIPNNCKATVLLLAVMGATDTNTAKGSESQMAQSRRDYFDIVKLLIKNKVNLNVQSQGGATALMHAVDREDEDCPVTELLVEAGADIEIVYKESNNVLTLALENEEFMKARILLQGAKREKRKQLLQSNLDKETQKDSRVKNTKVMDFLHEELAVVNTQLQKSGARLVMTEEDFDVAESKDFSEGSSRDSAISSATCTYSSPRKSPQKGKREAGNVEEDTAIVSSDGATSLAESSSDDATKPIVRAYSSPRKSPHRRKRKAEEDSANVSFDSRASSEESSSDSSAKPIVYADSSPPKRKHEDKDAASPVAIVKKPKSGIGFFSGKNMTGFDDGLKLSEQSVVTTAVVMQVAAESVPVEQAQAIRLG